MFCVCCIQLLICWHTLVLINCPLQCNHAIPIGGCFRLSQSPLIYDVRRAMGTIACLMKVYLTLQLLSNTNRMSCLCVMNRSSGMPSMTKLSTVPCSAAVTKSSNQRTEGGCAAKEVAVKNVVKSLKSLTLLIDRDLIHLQDFNCDMTHHGQRYTITIRSINESSIVGAHPPLQPCCCFILFLLWWAILQHFSFPFVL